MECARRVFLYELANFPMDVIDCVGVPAFGASTPLLTVVVRESFKRDFALTALNLLAVGHAEPPANNLPLKPTLH